VPDIVLAPPHLAGRTFLLGSGSGFVLHLPVARNIYDRTLHASKWFGASGFGRHYLSALRVWLVKDGWSIALNRTNQTSFSQYLNGVRREYDLDGARLVESYFVPGGCEAVVVSFNCDVDAEFEVEPQFDMRYYQAFNTDFSGYRAWVDSASRLWVTNSIEHATATGSPGGAERTLLRFVAVVASMDEDVRIDLLPPEERVRDKVYLVDEHRQKVVHSASLETHVESPDEAPIWDQYETKVYVPARFRGTLWRGLVLGFGSTVSDAADAVDRVRTHGVRALRREEVDRRAEYAGVTTGDSSVDTAYAQVLARFEQCLVARNMKVRPGRGQADTRVSAILAGDKYFLDPWKRDENISLGALLATGDFETARAILDDTWQHQDPRTGRLPQIIRLGEKLVYFSSDGTLWALHRLQEYTRVSGDSTLLEAKYPLVERFFEASLDFVRRGLLPSGGIIEPAYLWETWMDTPYTPRDGYPVEIELLWLTNVAAYLPIVSAANPALGRRLEEALGEGRETFDAFHLDGYLADSLSYDWEPRTILTPNGYMAFGLSFPLPEGIVESMLGLGRDQLAGRVGIRSLAPRDWPRVLSPEFMADPRNCDGPNIASVGIYNYHRGVEWLWLNQFFVRGELDRGDPDRAFDTYLAGQVHAALRESGVGGLSELHDIHGSLGADFQAWSMAGFVEAIRAFGGVEADAREWAVTVQPVLPHRWDRLQWKTRIKEAWLALEYRRNDDGTHVLTVEALDRSMPVLKVRVGLPGAGEPEGKVTAGAHLAGGRSWSGHLLSPGETLRVQSR
jgi:glycogen debranching enzyme